MMKATASFWRLLILGCGVLAARDAQAAVSLPFYDGFDYAEGNLNAVSAGNWIVGNGSSTFEMAVSNAAALTAPAGYPAATGKGVRRAPSGTARRCVLQYTSVPNIVSNTVYVSFLLNVQTAPSGNELMGYLDNNSSSQGSPQAGIFIGSGPTVGIGKKSSSPGFTSAITASTTHLVVVRYTFMSGNDQVDLWIDPSSSLYGATAAPASLGSVTGSTEPASLDYFQLATSAGAGSVAYADEYRVGLTWADVVPSGGPLIASRLGFTTQPANAAPGATMNPVVVQIQDNSSAAVPSNNVPITLTLSGSGSLSGTLTRNTDSTGKATFNDLSVDTAGTGDYFSAAASGIGAGLAGATSATFSIVSGGGGGGPFITQRLLTSAGFAVVGTNGTPSVLGQLYGAPDVTLPLSQWVLADAHNFDAGGIFASTNSLSPALPRAFYRLSTGGTSTKEEPPTLSGSPASLTVPVGSTATLTLAATGPLLQYLWFFNGNPINNATNPTLTIPNAQSANAGIYYCAVANPAGAVASLPATLRVGNYAPSIVTQPQSQTNVAGGTALFVATADGTVPLSYQWYRNASTVIPGATSNSLTLPNLVTNDAGQYSLRISNTWGVTNTSQAALVVTPVPTAPPDTNMLGFAQLAGVTGGLGGTDVYATNYLSLSNYVRHTEALVIHVTNEITGPGPGVDQYCYIYGNNKTILGEGTNASINGVDLRINATNIIIANILFQVTPVGTNDGVTIDGGSKGTGKFIWIDHCTVSNAQDGSIDVTKGADYLTVSWCKFLYAPKVAGSSHEFVHLIGSSDSDGSANAPFHVTFHHNWYADNAIERMPSVRWGRVHVFNCYYTCSGNNYCVRTRIGSQVLVENSYYLGVNDPWESLHTSNPDGLIKVTGSITNNCTFITNYFSGVSIVPGTNDLSYFTPVPYAYSSALNTATDVPYYVQTYAGHGKYPYVP